MEARRNPDAVTVTVNGTKLEPEVDESIGVYTYSVDFPAILEQWKADHPTAATTGTTGSAGTETEPNLDGRVGSRRMLTEPPAGHGRFQPALFPLRPLWNSPAIARRAPRNKVCCRNGTRRPARAAAGEERIHPWRKKTSFDVVSTVTCREFDNAFQQAKKELAQRYDLKDSGAEIALDKAKQALTVSAPSDFVARQVIDVIGSKLVKRGIDLSAVKWGDPQPAAGQSVRQSASIVDGIDKDTAGRINKDIKATKLKVKVQIEGDKLRVSSASRDTLQEVIAFLKGQDYGQPLQYVNYR